MICRVFDQRHVKISGYYAVTASNQVCLMKTNREANMEALAPYLGKPGSPVLCDTPEGSFLLLPKEGRVRVDAAGRIVPLETLATQVHLREILRPATGADRLPTCG